MQVEHTHMHARVFCSQDPHRRAGGLPDPQDPAVLCVVCREWDLGRGGGQAREGAGMYMHACTDVPMCVHVGMYIQQGLALITLYVCTHMHTHARTMPGHSAHASIG